jgi:hypothetical protein
MTATERTSTDTASADGATSSPHAQAHKSDPAHSPSSSGAFSSASNPAESAIGALGGGFTSSAEQTYIQEDDEAKREKQKRTNTAIICSMVGITLLGLAIATRFFFVKQKKKREEDPENLGTDGSNDSNSQEKAAGLSSDSQDGQLQDSREELVPAVAPRQSLWENIRKSFRPPRPPRPSALPPLPVIPPPPPNLAALRQQTVNHSGLRSNNNSRPSSDYNYNDAIYYGGNENQQRQQQHHMIPYESPAPPEIFVSDADHYEHQHQQQQHAGFPFPDYVNNDSMAYGQPHYGHQPVQNASYQPYM